MAVGRVAAAPGSQRACPASAQQQPQPAQCRPALCPGATPDRPGYGRAGPGGLRSGALRHSLCAHPLHGRAAHHELSGRVPGGGEATLGLARFCAGAGPGNQTTGAAAGAAAPAAGLADAAPTPGRAAGAQPRRPEPPPRGHADLGCPPPGPDASRRAARCLDAERGQLWRADPGAGRLMAAAPGRVVGACPLSCARLGAGRAAAPGHRAGAAPGLAAPAATFPPAALAAAHHRRGAALPDRAGCGIILRVGSLLAAPDPVGGALQRRGPALVAAARGPGYPAGGAAPAARASLARRAERLSHRQRSRRV